jgi:hypothetical protein
MQELFSRNPEYMEDRDISQIVLHMRDLRVRLEATATPPRHARIRDDAVPRASRARKTVNLGLDDIDFSDA